MDRRELLKVAASAAALTLLPKNAEAAWARAARLQPQDRIFSAPQSRLIHALSDTIIPRTDTPGASDVDVLSFITVVVVDYYDDAERTAFLSGLDAIDALSRDTAGANFADLATDKRDSVMKALEQPADRTAASARTYSRFKGLVVHGYFTSERVQKDVLHTNIMPGKFDGAANMIVRENGKAK